MERYRYDSNPQITFEQENAICRCNAESYCQPATNFERDLFKKSYVMLKGTLDGYCLLYTSPSPRD